eukprot:g50928.t1
MPPKSKKEDAKDVEGAKFKIEDPVISTHRGMLYEAKVVRVRKSDKPDVNIEYFVHYQGWNKKWDEWVPEERLFENNAENKQKMVNMRDTMEQTKDKTQKTAGKKRSRASAQEGEEQAGADEIKSTDTNELTIVVPNKLKQILIKDWGNITRNKMLVPLHRKPNISEIVDQFLESKKRKPEKQLLISEVATGIKVLFQNAIGRVLLYKFERPQFRDLSKDAKKDVQYCDYYGAEHLLRLFVKIPELLRDSNLQPEELKVLEKKLSEFLKFLDKNPKFFCAKYESTTTLMVGMSCDSHLQPLSPVVASHCTDQLSQRVRNSEA